MALHAPLSDPVFDDVFSLAAFSAPSQPFWAVAELFHFMVRARYEPTEEELRVVVAGLPLAMDAVSRQAAGCRPQTLTRAMRALARLGFDPGEAWVQQAWDVLAALMSEGQLEVKDLAAVGESERLAISGVQGLSSQYDCFSFFCLSTQLCRSCARCWASPSLQVSRLRSKLSFVHWRKLLACWLWRPLSTWRILSIICLTCAPVALTRVSMLSSRWWTASLAQKETEGHLTHSQASSLAVYLYEASDGASKRFILCVRCSFLPLHVLLPGPCGLDQARLSTRA